MFNEFSREFTFYNLPFPPVLRDTITEIVDATQAPQPLVVNAVLGAAAAAVQAGYRVRIEEGHEEPLGLLLLTIAASGEGKTPVFQAAFAGLREFEARMAQRHREQSERHEAALEVWKCELNVMTREFSRAVRKSDTEMMAYWQSKITKQRGEKPITPKKHRLLFSDTTPAALLKVLDAGSRAFTVLEDEGSRILHGELGKAFATLLKAWDGKLLDSNRVEGGDIYLPDPRMTYAVAIQQGAFEQFLLSKGNIAHDIGFFARCLPVWPESVQGFRCVASLTEKSTTAQTRFKNIQLSFLERRLQDGGLESAKSEKILTLSPAAKAVWQHHAQRIENSMREGGEFYEIRPMASKMAANAVRIAGVAHLYSETDSDEINSDTMEFAFSATYAYMGEHKKIFKIQSPQEVVRRRAKKLEDWLLKNIANNKYIQVNSFGYCYVKRSTIQKNGPSEIRHASDLNPVLDVLCAYCRIYRGRVNEGEVIHLNPNYFLPMLNGIFPAGYFHYA